MRTTGWVNGVKRGHTSQAGYLLVGPGRRNRIQLVTAVIGKPSMPRATPPPRRCSTGTSRGSRRSRRCAAHGHDARPDPLPARGEFTALEAGRTVRRIVPRGQRDDVDAQVVGGLDDAAGPILAGKAFGAVEILQNGRVVRRVPLVAASSVPAADLEQKAKSWFTSLLPLLLAVAVIAGTFLIGRQIRRMARNGRRTGDRPRAA